MSTPSDTPRTDAALRTLQSFALPDFARQLERELNRVTEIKYNLISEREKLRAENADLKSKLDEVVSELAKAVHQYESENAELRTELAKHLHDPICNAIDAAKGKE